MAATPPPPVRSRTSTLTVTATAAPPIAVESCCARASRVVPRGVSAWSRSRNVIVMVGISVAPDPALSSTDAATIHG
ncbi:hypothetical protein KZ829_13405 [Actinoplanes hulinensis]|uniref:Uncharacterized protein n=1 Tax=Actinoplanes hulinensis TaxID=1144547 RepID=A0ABS7B1Q6_9ACTN|nr:hypothetical protein [Actinoplanes hulinensis]MBW6434734.1 hypothetical protein [Actinoplanes hulinensis]